MLEFRTATHQLAAEVASAFLNDQAEVDAVLLVGSAARRQDANDLDLSAVVSALDQVPLVEERFSRFAAARPEFHALGELGPFVAVDFHATDGEFAPQGRGWTSGPDSFKLEIGKELAYRVILWERDARVSNFAADGFPSTTTRPERCGWRPHACTRSTISTTCS